MLHMLSSSTSPLLDRIQNTSRKYTHNQWLLKHIRILNLFVDMYVTLDEYCFADKNTNILNEIVTGSYISRYIRRNSLQIRHPSRIYQAYNAFQIRSRTYRAISGNMAPQAYHIQGRPACFVGQLRSTPYIINNLIGIYQNINIEIIYENPNTVLDLFMNITKYFCTSIIIQ